MTFRARRAAGAALLLGLLVSGCGRSAASETQVLSAARGGETAVVAYVNDGDTLRLRDGRRVRLLQIDAPELHGDCYGRAALAALLRLAPKGTAVTLERDRALDAKDAYGRLLRYVFVGGRNVDVVLVREGAASPYFFHKRRGRYADELLSAAADARAARRGYWGACPGAELNVFLGSITGPA